MPISINGSGTVTGVSVGGLPDGIVDADMIAANAVASGKVASGAITAAKLASGVGGKILQVVNSQSSSNKTTSGDTILALTSVDITPSATSSKVLVFFTCSMEIHGNQTTNGQVRLYRGTTSGTFLGGQRGGSANGSYNADASFGINYLDSPNTTSATTYTLAIRRFNSNTDYLTTDSRNYAVTALEIGA